MLVYLQYIAVYNNDLSIRHQAIRDPARASHGGGLIKTQSVARASFARTRCHYRRTQGCRRCVLYKVGRR